MSTSAQNFEHGTSVFCRVNATNIGTGAEKVEGAETFSRGSLGTSSKGCHAQILKKSKICLASRMRKIICSFPKWRQATKIKKKTRKNRGVVWQEDATNFLIDVWGEEFLQLQLENCKTLKQTSKFYEAILVSHLYIFTYLCILYIYILC